MKSLTETYEFAEEERADSRSIAHISNRFVKEKYGQFVSVDPQSIDKESEKSYFINGWVQIPYFIEDLERNERHLRFETFSDILALNLTLHEKALSVSGIRPSYLAHLIDKRRKETTVNLERLILEVAKDKFSNIPAVRNAHTPLIQILESMDRIVSGKIDLNQNVYVKWKKYLPLLNSLEIISMNENEISYGTKYKEFEKKNGKSDNDIELIETLFSYVLRYGREYLTDYCRLTAITPYIRTSYIYYNQATELERLVSIGIENVREAFRRIYSLSYTTNRLWFWAVELSRVSLLSLKGSNIKGKDDILIELVTKRRNPIGDAL